MTKLNLPEYVRCTFLVFLLLEFLNQRNLTSREQDEMVKTQVAVLQVTHLLEVAYFRPRVNYSTRNKVIISTIIMLLLIWIFLYQVIEYTGPIYLGGDWDQIDIPDWYWTDRKNALVLETYYYLIIEEIWVQLTTYISITDLPA